VGAVLAALGLTAGVVSLARSSRSPGTGGVERSLAAPTAPALSGGSAAVEPALSERPVRATALSEAAADTGADAGAPDAAVAEEPRPAAGELAATRGSKPAPAAQDRAPASTKTSADRTAPGLPFGAPKSHGQ
jgi:hypothetical protein